MTIKVVDYGKINIMENWKNKLYLGDNLQILHEYVPDESVDLIYLVYLKLECFNIPKGE